MRYRSGGRVVAVVLRRLPGGDGSLRVAR